MYLTLFLIHFCMWKCVLHTHKKKFKKNLGKETFSVSLKKFFYIFLPFTFLTSPFCKCTEQILELRNFTSAFLFLNKLTSHFLRIFIFSISFSLFNVRLETFFCLRNFYFSWKVLFCLEVYGEDFFAVSFWGELIQNY